MEEDRGMEPHRWTLRVSTSGKGRATVFVRQHQFNVGLPVQFDQEYDAISALEYVLGAIGADLVNGFQSLARKRRVAIDYAEAVVQGELNNPLTHLGVVGEPGHPGLEKISVRAYVSSLAPEEDVQRVWQEMLAISPLVRTFQPLVRFDLSLQLVI
jgi:hypothetical protein